jgi:hypothetical protein
LRLWDILLSRIEAMIAACVNQVVQIGVVTTVLFWTVVAGSADPLKQTAESRLLFQAYDNYDLTGADLRRLSDIELSACLNACQSDRQCQAFSYDKWDRQCSLKQAVGSFRFEPRSASGITANSAFPPMSNEPIVMDCFSGRGFPASGHKSIVSSSFQQCEKSCEEDKDCVAFEHLDSAKTCSLFQNVDRMTPDQTAVSGVKHQLAASFEGSGTCASFGSRQSPEQTEEEAYQSARGDAEKLREYVATCSFCSHAEEARQGIAWLEQQSRQSANAAPTVTSPIDDANRPMSGAKYQLEWERAYPIPETNAGMFGILLLRNGDFLVQASSFNDGEYCSAVIRIKSDGTPLWMKYLDPHSDRQHCDRDLKFRSLDDDSILVVGNRLASDVESMALATRLTPEGKIIWQKLLSGTSFDVVRLSEQYFLVVGSKNTLKRFGGDVGWVLTISADGALGAESRLGSPNVMRALRSAKRTKDDGVVLSGTTSVGEYDWNGWLLRLDHSLSMVWEKFLSVSKSSADTLSTLGKNHLVILSKTDQSPQLFLIDEAGNAQWQIQLSPDRTRAECVSVNDHRCLLATWGKNGMARLELLNDAGNLDPIQISFGSRELSDLAIASNGDLIVAGSQKDGDKTVGWLARYVPNSQLLSRLQPIQKDAGPYNASPQRIEQGPQATASLRARVLGIEIAEQTSELRSQYKIKGNVNGVLVTGVESATIDLAPGDVILAVQYAAVATPAEMQTRLEQVRSTGKTTTLLTVSKNGDGGTRFVLLKLQ